MANDNSNLIFIPDADQACLYTRSPFDRLCEAGFFSLDGGAFLLDVSDEQGAFLLDVCKTIERQMSHIAYCTAYVQLINK